MEISSAFLVVVALNASVVVGIRQLLLSLVLFISGAQLESMNSIQNIEWEWWYEDALIQNLTATRSPDSRELKGKDPDHDVACRNYKTTTIQLPIVVHDRCL